MFYLMFFFKNTKAESENEVIVRYDAYIKKVVRRTIMKNEKLFKYFDWEDLYQEGRIAFLKAMQVYNPNSGYQLSAYASRSIHNHLISLLRKKAVKKVYQEEADKSMMLCENGKQVPKPAAETCTCGEMRDVEFSLDYAPVIRFILRMSREHPDEGIRRGMNGVLMLYQGYTLSDIAKKAGMSSAGLNYQIKKARKILAGDAAVKRAFGR